MADKERIIFTGLTGTLGKEFLAKYSDKYDIIGVDRKTHDLSKKIKIDCLPSLQGNGLPFTHAVFSANSCAQKKLIEYTDKEITAAMNVAIGSVITMVQQLVKSWEGSTNDKTITIISSVSGLKPYGLNQVLYGTIKAAQLAMVDQLATQLQPLNVRVNAIVPTAFPRIVSTAIVAAAIDELISYRHNRFKYLIDGV